MTSQPSESAPTRVNARHVTAGYIRDTLEADLSGFEISAS